MDAQPDNWYYVYVPIEFGGAIVIKTHWQQALDSTIAALHANLELSEPPFDALRSAKRLGIEVAFDRSQRARGRRKTLAGQQSIFLRPEDRPERVQWAAAHELGEVFAHQVFRAADWSGTEIPPRLREQIANLFASRFLLPTATFAVDCVRLEFDLPRLKSRYTTASHELIARRMLDVKPDAVLTILDQGNVTTRVNGYEQRVTGWQPEERECWRTAHETGLAQLEETHGLAIRVWPVHEPGWKREILWTSPHGDWLAEEPFEVDEPSSIA